MFKRLRTAIAAFVAPEMFQTSANTTETTNPASTGDDNTHSSVGDVNDHGQVVQARDITGGVSFNRNNHSTEIHNSGIVNNGGTNTYTNTHFGDTYTNSQIHNGNGDQINNVVSNGARVGVQAGNITGGTIIA